MYETSGESFAIRGGAESETVELYPGVIADTVDRALGMEALFLTKEL